MADIVGGCESVSRSRFSFFLSFSTSPSRGLCWLSSPLSPLALLAMVSVGSPCRRLKEYTDNQLLVDSICNKYDKYDVEKHCDSNVFGDDAFVRLYAFFDADIEALLQAHLNPITVDSIIFKVLHDWLSACPLVFPDTMQVARGCGDGISNKTACCNAMESYVSHLQKQSLIMNLQALDCAKTLAMKLKRSKITADIYGLCHITLKDFFLQGMEKRALLATKASLRTCHHHCDKYGKRTHTTTPLKPPRTTHIEAVVPINTAP
ncbi:putative GPI-anchored protein [Vigna angularis]|uniref:Putative GPI-anchored protein n=1 Tax=Phaseolus angularis TaxID=3914 RepID=A0A8T0LI85_PHAAN|nr:putative GPI-anchored protein [Vigna angularis]